MILIDANLLVYAHVTSFAQHEKAGAWLDDRINGAGPGELPDPVLLAFARIISNPRIFDRSVSVSAAWTQAESWLAAKSVWIPLPTDRNQQILGPLLANTESRANLVPEAHLAALAIEDGLQVCSTDGDFARFRGLEWENPLQ